MLKYEKKINFFCPQLGDTAYSSAYMGGHKRIAEYLLKKETEKMPQLNKRRRLIIKL